MADLLGLAARTTPGQTTDDDGTDLRSRLDALISSTRDPRRPGPEARHADELIGLLGAVQPVRRFPGGHR